MKIDNRDNIICEESIAINRHVSVCDYKYNGIYLFTERSYFPHNWFKPPVHTQKFYQFVLKKEECDILASKFGAESIEHPYCNEDNKTYYLCFEDNDKAVTFCESQEFDSLMVAQKV